MEREQKRSCVASGRMGEGGGGPRVAQQVLSLKRAGSKLELQTTSTSSPFALPWLPCHVDRCWLSATCLSASGSVLPASWLRGFGAAAFMRWRGLSRTSPSTWSCPFASSSFGAGSAGCGWWPGQSPALGRRQCGRGRGL